MNEATQKVIDLVRSFDSESHYRLGKMKRIDRLLTILTLILSTEDDTLSNDILDVDWNAVNRCIERLTHEID